MRMALLVLGALLTTQVSAARLLSIEVDHKKGVYSMRSEVWFDASIVQVFEVFRRWDYSEQFSSAIVESRDLENDAQGRPQFYVRNRGCVLFFCKSFERSGYVELQQNLVLSAFTDPEISDFSKSDERWDFSERDGGTVVIYNLKMTPKFWIPPAVGPFFIKRKLRNDGGDAIDRIEVIAKNIDAESLTVD